jgi:hypothetical protein
VTFVSILDTCEATIHVKDNSRSSFFPICNTLMTSLQPANQFSRFYRVTAHRHVNSDPYSNRKFVADSYEQSDDVNYPFETLLPFRQRYSGHRCTGTRSVRFRALTHNVRLIESLKIAFAVAVHLDYYASPRHPQSQFSTFWKLGSSFRSVKRAKF